jgi:metal-dependent amidase/aminoacylase/carboxypeptidase family protein
MAHPSNKTRVISNMLALVDVTFIFTGKSAHAAASPHKGINALDGAILTFNNVNALRQQIRGDAKIHGIITEGGVAPNIIPARAVCNFYVRAADLPYFNELLERTKNCARGAAAATGCKLKIVTGKMVYHPFRVNNPLAAIFRENIKNLGIVEDIIPEGEGIGSSDIGNISQILPTIHPEFSIGPESVINHSPEFTKASVSDYAMKRMIVICKALALTVADLILFPKKLQQVKSEHKKDDT